MASYGYQELDVSEQVPPRDYQLRKILVARPRWEKHTMTVVVGPKGSNSLAWDNIPQPKLTVAFEEKLGDHDGRGVFGVFSRRAHVVIELARVKILE